MRRKREQDIFYGPLRMADAQLMGFSSSLLPKKIIFSCCTEICTCFVHLAYATSVIRCNIGHPSDGMENDIQQKLYMSLLFCYIYIVQAKKKKKGALRFALGVASCFEGALPLLKAACSSSRWAMAAARRCWLRSRLGPPALPCAWG